ncbi:condensin complex subunit 3 [Dorcoceras hygrometricum]|uniref:Condensin complex subunit 3 n=1 Tax=Dorcoceras hygrometricum TaxID=472368 RepID=A0A2Z7CST4_9LAMI|nr:condensin complex subunit 3 [Dorcoceras hygrometricum]
MQESEEHQQQLRKFSSKIAKVLDEARISQATHIRKLKELADFRSSRPPIEFIGAFSRAITPLFNFHRRTASADRIIKFVAVFACSRNAKDAASCDEFLENFLRFLILASGAANKTVRFRACQIISEIIVRLPDDAEVSNELWDEVIECVKLRVADKVSAVRTFAFRALSRFANDSENRDILDLFLEKLPLEQNADVRKTLVLSLPPSNDTLTMIIDCTLDVNETVRKAAYCVLGSKFPLQSLSIKLRTVILQRGLSDRSPAVAKECLKLMRDEWLEKGCNGDPVELLRYLDVETYESIGESVMVVLLNEELIKLQDGQTICKFLASEDEGAEGQRQYSIDLMDPEVALFWKMVCKHLQKKAQTKGSDAAMTTGTESAVYASEASDYNDLLDKILPTSISEYVQLVKAHIAAGSNYRFASRQLLLLGAMLDFSDSSNRKVASDFIQYLLHRPLDVELDDSGNDVFIGDGLNLGGERDWAAAVAKLTKKVHAALGEFENVVLSVIEELARPCRERTADCKQWLHCLAVTALLLENTSSFHFMQRGAITADEILHSLLLPGAKNAHLDVQRAAIRCLGLFGFLERKLTTDLIMQLRSSFVNGPCTITTMASKALLDLGIWHGVDAINTAMNCDLSSQLHHHETPTIPVKFYDGNDDAGNGLLDLLYAGIQKHNWGASLDDEEEVSIQGILGEGLAKILLLSEKFPGTSASTHHLLLVKLINLYFGSESGLLLRLKQCLCVFFEHYPALSANHKKCLSKAFVPVMRSLWPGINGNAAGSTVMVSNMRKRAIQASRFMLQMMQVPLYAKETATQCDNNNGNQDGETSPALELESGEEGLAIRIAVEVANFNPKKTAAEKSYISALCRILILLNFRTMEQDAIKLMRRLLNRTIPSMAVEKDIYKELRQMAECLRDIDRNPDEKLSHEQAHLILGKLELELEVNLNENESTDMPPTPAPQSTRRVRPRRRARDADESSSDDELSPTCVVSTDLAATSTRSQRASKTIALSRMTANLTTTIDEDCDLDTENSDETAGSEVTSEDDLP